MERGLTIVGLGEALFDVFPDRTILGGAPLNVAVHAHQLLSALGGSGIPASRIGRDPFGLRLIEELCSRGIPTSGLQYDDERPTGQVRVTLVGGEPRYEIVEDSAWDRLEFTDDWQHLARRCDAVCFGTLGRRTPKSAATIAGFLRRATTAIRMFDVNLRQDFFTPDLLREGCALATVVKLNRAELPIVSRLLAGPDGDEQDTDDADGQAVALRERFSLEAVVLTRGSAGTAIYTAKGFNEGEPVHSPAKEDADSVGAGDACAAATLLGMLLGWPVWRTIALANATGAFVASQPGATPTLPPELLGFVTAQTPRDAIRLAGLHRSEGEMRGNKDS